MRFHLHAKGSGKTIRVFDRIAGADAFNGFVDPDGTKEVDVASNDGHAGEVDITSRMRADAPWIADYTDYDVRLDETIEVDDN